MHMKPAVLMKVVFASGQYVNLFICVCLSVCLSLSYIYLAIFREVQVQDHAIKCV